MHRADRTDAPAPVGAIRTRQEVRDLVIEARKEKKAIRIWTVTQSGHLDCFYLTSKSRLHKPEDLGLRYTSENDHAFWHVDAVVDHSCIGMKGTNSRWFKKHELLGSYNIEASGGNCHYAFTSKLAASRYSEELKNDARYQQSVKEHHERCARMFSGW